MDPIGLIDSITDATASIDFGRKAFAIRGKAEEARKSYEAGIILAMTVFEAVQATTDPETIILAEYTFIVQELQFCHEKDKATFKSLTQAKQWFDDAFLALKVVKEKIHYHAVENTTPHHKNYRYNSYPLDSFHVACKSHKTRLQNILRTPGVDLIEKDLLLQRCASLTTGQIGYAELQEKALNK